MVMMTSCRFAGDILDIDETIELRDRSPQRPDFRCIECGEKVRAYKAGGNRCARTSYLPLHGTSAAVTPGVMFWGREQLIVHVVEKAYLKIAPEFVLNVRMYLRVMVGMVLMLTGELSMKM